MGVVVLGWLCLRVVPQIAGQMRNAHELLTVRSELLARLEEQLADLDRLADSASGLQEQIVALAPAVLAGSGEAEAQHDLMGRIRMAAQHASVKLTNAEAEVDSVVAGSLYRVSVRMRFEGDVAGLVALLRALDVDPAALLLDDLKVVAIDPIGEDGTTEVLRVELTVRGWRHTRGDPA